MSLSLIYDPLFLTHDTGPMHVEVQQRLESILQSIQADENLSTKLQRVSPKTATDQDLLRCHDERRIQGIRSYIERGGTHLDVDTPVSETSFEVACLAAGAAIAG